MSVPDLVSAAPVHVCVVYHSAYGHTAKVAQYIAQGAEQAGADVEASLACGPTVKRMSGV